MVEKLLLHDLWLFVLILSDVAVLQNCVEIRNCSYGNWSISQVSFTCNFALDPSLVRMVELPFTDQPWCLIESHDILYEITILTQTISDFYCLPSTFIFYSQYISSELLLIDRHPMGFLNIWNVDLDPSLVHMVELPFSSQWWSFLADKAFRANP